MAWSTGTSSCHPATLVTAQRRSARCPDMTLTQLPVALDGYAGSETGLSAFESFTGYLTFDALVGNTDRHHENWAVLTGSQSLAPTYDHGASLGFNASPARRARPGGLR